MKALMTQFLAFMAKTLNGQDPQSFGRFMAFVSAVFWLGADAGYITFVMLHFKQLGFSVHDILPGIGILGAQAAFCMSFYAPSKFFDIWVGQPKS